MGNWRRYNSDKKLSMDEITDIIKCGHGLYDRDIGDLFDAVVSNGLGIKFDDINDKIRDVCGNKYYEDNKIRIDKKIIDCYKNLIYERQMISEIVAHKINIKDTNCQIILGLIKYYAQDNKLSPIELYNVIGTNHIFSSRGRSPTIRFVDNYITEYKRNTGDIFNDMIFPYDNQYKKYIMALILTNSESCVEKIIEYLNEINIQFSKHTDEIKKFYLTLNHSANKRLKIQDYVKICTRPGTAHRLKICALQDIVLDILEIYLLKTHEITLQTLILSEKKYSLNLCQILHTVQEHFPIISTNEKFVNVMMDIYNLIDVDDVFLLNHLCNIDENFVNTSRLMLYLINNVITKCKYNFRELLSAMIEKIPKINVKIFIESYSTIAVINCHDLFGIDFDLVSDCRVIDACIANICHHMIDADLVSRCNLGACIEFITCKIPNIHKNNHFVNTAIKIYQQQLIGINRSFEIKELDDAYIDKKLIIYTSSFVRVIVNNLLATNVNIKLCEIFTCVANYAHKNWDVEHDYILSAYVSHGKSLSFEDFDSINSIFARVSYYDTEIFDALLHDFINKNFELPDNELTTIFKKKLETITDHVSDSYWYSRIDENIISCRNKMDETMNLWLTKIDNNEAISTNKYLTIGTLSKEDVVEIIINHILTVTKYANTNYNLCDLAAMVNSYSSKLNYPLDVSTDTVQYYINKFIDARINLCINYEFDVYNTVKSYFEARLSKIIYAENVVSITNYYVGAVVKKISYTHEYVPLKMIFNKMTHLINDLNKTEFEWIRCQIIIEYIQYCYRLNKSNIKNVICEIDDIISGMNILHTEIPSNCMNYLKYIIQKVESFHKEYNVRYFSNLK